MNNQDKLENKIKKIVAEHLKENPDSINTEGSLRKDFEIDSFGIFELVHEIQSTFKVQITDEELMKIDSIKDIVEFLNTKGL